MEGCLNLKPVTVEDILAFVNIAKSKKIMMVLMYA